MMHVCLHDGFGVNYACDFAYSSDEEKPLESTEKCDAITVRSNAKERELTFSACHQEVL
jgi:hypothetical protein